MTNDLLTTVLAVVIGAAGGAHFAWNIAWTRGARDERRFWIPKLREAHDLILRMRSHTNEDGADKGRRSRP